MTDNVESANSDDGSSIGPGKMSYYMVLQAAGMIGVAAIAAIFWEPAFWSLWSLEWKAAAIGIGVGAALAVVGIVTEELPFWPFTRLKQDYLKMVGLFRGASYLQSFWISLCAGVSEEILLRGCMEPILRGYVGTIPALVIVALLFGGVHALSFAYFLVIAIISVIFSAIMLQTDNLIAPIIAHTEYDFLALAFSVKLGRAKEGAVELE